MGMLQVCWIRNRVIRIDIKHFELIESKLGGYGKQFIYEYIGMSFIYVFTNYIVYLHTFSKYISMYCVFISFSYLVVCYFLTWLCVIVCSGLTQVFLITISRSQFLKTRMVWW